MLANSPHHLQTMLDTLHDYACKWRFDINIKKSYVVPIVHHRRQRHDRPHHHIDDDELEKKDEITYLGATLHRDFRTYWKKHTTSIIRKAKTSSARLRFVYAHHLSSNALTMAQVWQMKVRPQVEYAAGVWGALIQGSAADDIEKVQTGFMRSMLNCGKRIRNATLLYIFNLSPLSIRRAALTLGMWSSVVNLPDDTILSRVLRAAHQAYLNGQTARSWLAAVHENCKVLDHSGSFIDSFINFLPIRKTLIDTTIRKRKIADATLIEQSLIPGVYSITRRKIAKLAWPSLIHRHIGATLRLLWIDGSLPSLDYIGAKEGWTDDSKMCCLCSTAAETAQHIFIDCAAHKQRRNMSVEKLSDLVGDAVPLASPWRGVNAQSLLLEWGSDLDNDVRKTLSKNATLIILNYLRDVWRARCACFEFSLDFLRKKSYNFVGSH